jgi:hypothetical protein
MEVVVRVEVVVQTQHRQQGQFIVLVEAVLVMVGTVQLTAESEHIAQRSLVLLMVKVGAVEVRAVEPTLRTLTLHNLLVLRLVMAAADSRAAEAEIRAAAAAVERNGLLLVAAVQV